MAYAGGCKKGATILLTNWICQWSWHFPISCSLSVLAGSDPSSFLINERERERQRREKDSIFGREATTGWGRKLLIDVGSSFLS